MQHEIQDFIQDIEREINFLLSKTQNTTFESFINDEVLTRACERSLEIIGEAVKIIPNDIRKQYPTGNCRYAG